MKAMILAAGRGERMRPATDRVPKPLLRVGGKPLIAWLLGTLAREGFTDIVVNVSHLGETIEQTLGDGAAWGVRIAYSREAQALETAGGIASALHLLGAHPFLVVNGDVYTDFAFAGLKVRAAALPERAVAHLVLVPNPPHHPDGDFALEGGMIVDGKDRLTFSGIGLYHPELFKPVAPGTKYQLAALLREPIAAGRVSAERYDGVWIDVGTPERLADVDRLLAHSQD